MGGKGVERILLRGSEYGVGREDPTVGISVGVRQKGSPCGDSGGTAEERIMLRGSMWGWVERNNYVVGIWRKYHAARWYMYVKM